jgi:hypothetical protein
MKILNKTRVWFYILLISSFSFKGFSQNTNQKNFRINLKKTNAPVLDISRKTLGKLDSLGFQFEPNYNYLSRNYSEQFDFNKDGFKDLIIVFPKEPSIGSAMTILLWDDAKKKFVEDPNYFILGHGDHMFYYDTVEDFDGDGDLDIYFPIENYHGENGKQPKYYFANDFYMPGNLLINTGSGFQRKYIDTTTMDHGNRRGYFSYSSASLIYYDDDNKKDLIAPSINQHPLNKGFLASKYSLDLSGEITRTFVFPWDKNIQYKGQTHSMMFKNYKDKIYAFIQPKEDYPDGTNTFYYYTYPEVWIYDKSKNGQPPLLLKKIELKRNKIFLNQSSILNHDTFYITDLDKDGNEEIVIGMFGLPVTNKHFSIHVFDNTGNEITNKWFINEEYIDHNGTAANGFDLLDLNGDGLDDILFRDHFNSSGGQISTLLNTGNSFEQQIIKTESTEGFNIAIDLDRNGKYEILKAVNKIFEINNSVYQFEIDYINCNSLTKPIFSSSKFEFCEGDSIRLSITNINKGDSLKWYYGTNSDLTNTSSKSFNDNSKVFVTKKDSAGCFISSDTIQLTKKSRPNAPALSRDAENNLVADIANLTWYKDGLKIQDTTQKIKPPSNGLYSASTIQNGCSSVTSQGYFYFVNAISNLSNGEYVKISPNPTIGHVSFNYLLQNETALYLTMIEVNGKLLISNKRIISGSSINLGSISKGTYIIQMKTKSGKLILTKQLVKE